MDYFAHIAAAERYAKGRPYFHPLVIDRIREVCRLERSLHSALDVGCGTGQSTVALAAIAEYTVGIDVSQAMLSHAPRHPRVAYARSAGEALPFPADRFDLITCGLAFHWLDRRRFLNEAARVLAPHGWLAVYNDSFVGEMIGNPDYARWNTEEYKRRYPTPPRHGEPLSDNDARRSGLDPVDQISFRHTVDFTPEGLVAYLVTQSNIIAASESGREDIRAITDWLLASVRPLFRAESETFTYRCVIDAFRRAH